MAKTYVKHRKSGTRTKKGNKSLRLTAHIGKVHQAEHELKQKQTPNPTKVANTPSTCQQHAPSYYENIGIDDATSIHWSQAIYRNPTAEDEEFEMKMTSTVASYQLQQWISETSSPCITLAERLEKSKWKYEGTWIGEDLCKGDCRESWGRKPYDWILFSE
ncbi:hypothetical protein N431DRAFT_474553 [Stipitochalara longipes BDJ]|nr:hypothetical protein N431DRAFT_474553 [Stipitochalara longipes BDJ]